MSKWAGCLLLTAVTVLVYANSLPGAFYFDDYGLMLDNPRVGGGFSYWSFVEHYGGRPLTLWSLHWNERLAGRDPLWFHLVNLLLHAASVALLFLLVQQWTGRRRLALLAGLIFGLHPLQTQAVNYVWARSVLLMTLFGLLSLWLAGRRREWASMAAFQLAVWGRAEALVLALPLAIVWLRTKGADGRRPLAVIALLCALNLAGLAWGLMRHAPLEVAWTHSAAVEFWLQQPAVLATYLRLALWPAGLSIDHAWRDWPPVGVMAAAVGLALLAGLLWRWRRRQPIPAWAGLAGLLLLLPSALVPNTVLLSENRAYLPMAALAVAGAWALDELWRRRRPAAVAALVVLAVGMSAATRQRNRLWNDEIALWRDAAARAPAFDRVRYNFGFALARQGRIEEAERQFRLARDLAPSDGRNYAALGYCAEVRERISQAERLYLQALLLDPANRYAREALLRLEGRFGAAASLPGGREHAVESSQAAAQRQSEVNW